jgi:transposase
MVRMSQIETIKQKYAEGQSVRGIALDLNLDWKTVDKYVRKEDFNETVEDRIRAERGSKLDPYKAKIAELIDQEKGWFRKQRWTAVRMHEYLVKELGIDELSHSYHLVRRYMNRYRQICRQQETAKGTALLTWYPGEAQADFGEADTYDENGNLVRRKYLLLYFPYSDRVVGLFMPGENCECVCQGLLLIFTYLGKVPKRIVFDNATGIGHRVRDNLRENVGFTRFRLHFGFSATYANPASGNEKGGVENVVGCFRRNRMVPPLHVPADFRDYDTETMLPMTFAFKAEGNHYRKGTKRAELFGDDMAAMHAVPQSAFEVCRIDPVQLNRNGSFVLGGKHWYSLGPAHSGESVLVKKTAWEVTVFKGDDGAPIKGFRREYGDDNTESYHLEALLRGLDHKPNSWPNSIPRARMADGPFKDFLDGAATDDRRKGIYLFGKVADDYGFADASVALNLSARNGGMPDKSAVVATCRRMQDFPLGLSENSTGVSLKRFDELLSGKEA